MRIKNSAGKVYYGMHFYPGVAEYRDNPNEEAYRIFINEDTIRSMSPSFAGRPIYVQHVDEIEIQPGALVDREADGYVVESFFNSNDGKTWAKVIIVTERGEKAIRTGWRFSNAYIPKAFSPGGLWNGVSYQKQVIAGEFEHLAIVPNPRYEDAPKILSPEEFKLYNEQRELELRKLANSKEERNESENTKEKKTMSLNFFRRKTEKVENSLDGVLVLLPKSKREVTIEKLVNDADDMMMQLGQEQMANGDHMVELDGKKMKLNDLLETHKKMNEELLALKAEKGAKDPEPKKEENAEEPKKEKEEPKKENEDEPKKEKEEPKKENEEEKKKQNDLTHFEALKNAHNQTEERMAVVSLSDDMVARGKSRYGSN